MTYSDAATAVSAMLKSYPPSELDQRGYIQALADCLVRYPRCIAERCAAIDGVVSTTRFKVTVADITAWCEAELGGMQAIVARDDIYQKTLVDREAYERRHGRTPVLPPKPDGRRANLRVAPGRPRYEEMCERARDPNTNPAEFMWPPDGSIKVALSWWQRGTAAMEMHDDGARAGQADRRDVA